MVIFLIIFIILILSILIFYFHKKEYYKDDKKPIITFIIPTIGRDSLKDAIQSLKNMNNENWEAIVIFDGVQPNIKIIDKRIRIIHQKEKNGTVGINGAHSKAGFVRNKAVPYIRTEWIGFLDDDDLLFPTYIDSFYNHIKDNPNLDVIIFRMKNRNSNLIIPPLNHKDFVVNNVGISFCMKTKDFKDNPFESSLTEDFDLLNKLRNKNKNIIISDHIEYIFTPALKNKNN